MQKTNASNPDPTHCDRVTLYYREGSSDKVYQAHVAPAADGLFTVEFAYGRRGSTLKTGTKTAQPVGHNEAHQILWKLVRQKMDKGYTPGEDGTPYAGTGKEGQATGVACQLLNAIDEAELARRIADPRWVMQEKFDGRRMLVRRGGDEITGINRNGLETALPESIVQAALALPGRNWLLDGEAVGDTLHAFDLLELGGTNLRGQTYGARLAELEGLLSLHTKAPSCPWPRPSAESSRRCSSPTCGRATARERSSRTSKRPTRRAVRPRAAASSSSSSTRPSPAS